MSSSRRQFTDLLAAAMSDDIDQEQCLERDEQELEEDYAYDYSSGNKRKKLSEEERLRRCRERNRVHARNTRERKKQQMETLLKSIHDLTNEKNRLTNSASVSSVASILITLSGGNEADMSVDTAGLELFRKDPADLATIGSKDVASTMESIRSKLENFLSDDAESEDNNELLQRDRHSCSVYELAQIRRERNRRHAKKARLRKKKMLEEMEAIVSKLQREVEELGQSGSTPAAAPVAATTSLTSAEPLPVPASSSSLLRPPTQSSGSLEEEQQESEEESKPYYGSDGQVTETIASCVLPFSVAEQGSADQGQVQGIPSTTLEGIMSESRLGRLQNPPNNFQQISSAMA